MKAYSIAVSSPITPAEPLPPLPEIPRGSLVIVEGRAPIWRYGMALLRRDRLGLERLPERGR